MPPAWARRSGCTRRSVSVSTRVPGSGAGSAPPSRRVVLASNTCSVYRCSLSGCPQVPAGRPVLSEVVPSVTADRTASTNERLARRPRSTTMPGPDREKALELALAQIDKNFGKGSVMRLGDEIRAPDRGHPDRLDRARRRARHRRPAARPRRRDLRPGVLAARPRSRCTRSPTRRPPAASRRSSTPSTRSTPTTPRSSASTPTRCWSPSPTPVSRRSRSPTC